MPMMPTASHQAEFSPHQQAVIAEHTDVHFAARAPPMAAANVAFTGAAVAGRGNGIVMHEHEVHVTSLGFGADFIATNNGAEIPTIGGRKPINSEWAGKTHPSGIEFD